jgi:hypothetical protein
VRRYTLGIYYDRPYAREVGHVEEAAATEDVVASDEFMEGQDVTPEILADVVYWLRKGAGLDPLAELNRCRNTTLKGAKYCNNEWCEVVGLLKDFKVCPQCKTARYCGDACQKQDWTTGGHRATCGKFASKVGQARLRREDAEDVEDVEDVHAQDV